MIGLINRRRAAQSSSPAPNYLMTATSNPEVFAICLAQGWCSAEGMTYEEAAAVTDIVRVFQGKNIVHFEELEYFGVTELKYSAFMSCTNLETITFPTNFLKFNGTAIFQGCQNLKNIDIPSTVTDIGSNCFSSCPNIQYAIVRPTIPPTLGNGVVFGTTGTTYPIYVPDASVNDYKAANNWSGELIVGRIKPLSEFVEPQAS